VKSLRTLAFVAAAFSLAISASAGTTLENAVAADDLEAIKANGPVGHAAAGPPLTPRATRNTGSVSPPSSIAWAGSPKKRKTR